MNKKKILMDAMEAFDRREDLLETLARQGEDLEPEHYETLDYELSIRDLEPAEDEKVHAFLVALAQEKLEEAEDSEILEFLGF
jgi:hypothetical protein